MDYAQTRILRTNFHDVDEFQIVFSGDGMLGNHALNHLISTSPVHSRHTAFLSPVHMGCLSWRCVRTAIWRGRSICPKTVKYCLINADATRSKYFRRSTFWNEAGQ